ncbi:MAG TPA: diguanylate cyclase [Pyrinomonadaceae bacterium]|nr:diguanylate cyclase [Pyrinomonadaceae bacterium]
MRRVAADASDDERAPVILVADDEPVNLALIKRRLEWEEYEIATAEDGGQAVEIAKRILPDLIILDVMMPVLDGLQACRLIKEDPSTSDIPVIFLSALDDMDTKVNGLSLGANDYISKPFRVEELLARVAVAIRLKRERDRLRQSAEELRRRAEAASEMSVTDALTGLLNRYGLQRALQREMSEARQLRRPLSCLLIDIDYFKHINDTHGHAAGDTALMQVARLLLDGIRRPAELQEGEREDERRAAAAPPRADVVCRYGGEEFLLLAPETQLEGALALAEKIRRAAAERLFGDGERIFPLTLSVGVAELRASESGNDMIARADDALYQAKQQGRNRAKAAGD